MRYYSYGFKRLDTFTHSKEGELIEETSENDLWTQLGPDDFFMDLDELLSECGSDGEEYSVQQFENRTGNTWVGDSDAVFYRDMEGSHFLVGNISEEDYENKIL